MSEKEIWISKILEKVPNKFLLSVAVAKRARQLKEGAKPLVDIEKDELLLPIIKALEEIEENKISVNLKERTDEDDLLGEINDYVDVDFLEEPETDEEKPKKEVKQKGKSKSLAA